MVKGWVRGVLQLWEGGEIPFTIEPGLPIEAHVRDAMSAWEQRTPIRFVPRTDDHRDWVNFVSGVRCSSKVGRVGGPQEVTLTRACRTGVIMHEIGHLVGLGHEHSRRDRDRYVTVCWENIAPAAHYNFLPLPEGNEELDEYDLDSIMHYSRVAFSRNRGETLVPNDPGLRHRAVGQRRQLSDGDVAGVRRLYAKTAAAA